MIILFLSIVFALVLLTVLGLVAFTGWTARRVEAAIPPAGRFVEVLGTRLHYVDVGHGPVFLMIHGLASQLQSFTFALSARLPGYRLLIVDRPGAGYSKAAPSARFGAQADLIAAFLRTLGVDRALVVGHSLGGGIALALAVDHPEIVAGLALVAPVTQAQDRAPEALRGLAVETDAARWLIGWTLAVPTALWRRAATLAALFGPDPVPADYGTRGGGLMILRPWSFRNASRDLDAARRDLGLYAKRYHEIAAPVGVLFGTDDRILDPRTHGEGLRRQIPGLDLELIDHGGHMLPLSAPDRTAAFVARISAACGMARDRAA